MAESSATAARTRTALPGPCCDDRGAVSSDQSRAQVASVVVGVAPGSLDVQRCIRGCHSEDLTHSVPPGCTFRRYDPPTRPGFYKGELPSGKVDPSTGHKSKNCGWGFWANRTPEEAMNEVFAWLWKHGQ